jgi:hypothetical protein
VENEAAFNSVLLSEQTGRMDWIELRYEGERLFCLHVCTEGGVDSRSITRSHVDGGMEHMRKIGGLNKVLKDDYQGFLPKFLLISPIEL